MTAPTVAVYSPRQAAEQLQVAERTLRYWSRYFAPYLSSQAATSATGKGHRHRRYTVEDLSTLRVVRDLTGRGAPLARVADVLAGRVDREIVEATTRPRTPSPGPALNRRSPRSTRPTGDDALAALAAARRELVASRQEIHELREQLRLAQQRIAELEASRQHERTQTHVPVASGARPAVSDRRSLGRQVWGGERTDQRIARRIIRLMAEQLMTRAELAARSGIPMQLLREILDQRRLPDESTISAIAAGLGVDESHLLQD